MAHLYALQGALASRSEAALLAATKEIISTQGIKNLAMIDIADLHYDCDCSKAKNLLGWKPQHSLDKKLEQLIAWAKNNLRDFYRENNLIVPSSLEKQWSREDAQKSIGASWR